MDLAEVLRFLEGEKLAVLATASEDGRPEAAVMGFVVTPELEIIFDTVRSFRKVPEPEEKPASGVGDRVHVGNIRAV